MNHIDRYLEALRVALGENARRSVLDEVADHLREAADSLTESMGVSRSEAERTAVEAFGTVEGIASELKQVFESEVSQVLAFAREEASLSEAIEVEVDRVRYGPLTAEEVAKWSNKDPEYAEQVKGGVELYGVVLKERGGDRELCIFMGQFEAAAIATGKEGKTFARPMTHDLFADFIRSLDDFSVENVTVTRLEDKTFYAEIAANHHGEPMVVDCRPSDGIAVALRSGVPIYVHADVPPFSEAA